MVQIGKISLIFLALAIVACAAEAPRHRQRLVQRKLQPLKQRSVIPQKRILSRQQVEEAVTPYPTAEELKPEVAFEEGNQPDEVYGPPDQTYGPPEVDSTPLEQLPSEEAPEEFAPNPDAEEFQPTEEEQAPEEPEQPARLTNRRKVTKKNVASRLVQKKKTQKSQRLVVASAPVVAAPAPVAVAAPVAFPFAASPFNTFQSSQQYYVVNQPFTYTSQYQSW